MRLGLAFINAGTQRKAIRAGGGECFSENSSASGRSPTRAEFHTFQLPPEHSPTGPQSRLCPELWAGMFHVASRWWHCLVAPSHQDLPIGGVTARRSCTAWGDAQARCGKLCTSQPGFMGKCHISHSFPFPLCCKPFFHLRGRKCQAPGRLRPAPAPHSLCLCQQSRCRRGTHGAEACQHVQADTLGRERGAPGQRGPRRVGGTGGRGSASPLPPPAPTWGAGSIRQR